jgi:glycosyltransferase involved in cell wall biosynthesis
MEKIALLTTGHPPFDERIFYKFGCSFIQKGFSVSIICSTQTINTITEKISITGFDGSNLNKRRKISKILNELKIICPDLIICCEPLPILAAKDYQKTTAKKVIICYDITEWYPENVSLKLPWFKRIFSYFALYIFNIYVSNLVDILIFSENLKQKRYEFFAPSIKMERIEHYPVIKYFHYSLPKPPIDYLTIAFTGLLTIKRGFLNVIDVLEQVASKNKYKIILKVIGKFVSNKEESIIKDRLNKVKFIQINFKDWVDYKSLSDNLADVHICIDLREKDFIFNNSLPIKIFEYLACGKPVVYSDIKAITEELDIGSFGYLVNPGNKIKVKEIIANYIANPELLLEHSKNARVAAEQKYCWEKVEEKLLYLIEDF